MFKEKLLISKMPDRNEIIDHLGTSLPPKTTGHFQQIEGPTKGFQTLENAREMVVFISEENPESILDHPVFGPMLKELNDIGALFAQRRSPANRDYVTTLKSKVTSIPTKGNMGQVKVVHFIQGASPNGDPNGTEEEFHLPNDVRSATAEAADIVNDLVHQGNPSLAVYLGHEVTQSSNAPHIIKAIAKALGNVTYPDLYRTDSYNQSRDGRLSPEEETKLRDAINLGFTPSTNMTPEAQFTALNKAIDSGEFEFKSPESARRSTREALQNVYFISDAEGDINAESLLASFDEGDMVSRVQSMCKFLSEAPHNLLNCEVFVRVLHKLNENVRKLGANTEIEIFGENMDGIKITGSLNEYGKNLSVLEAVHQGAEELGPFVVRLKYRHPNAQGQPVQIIAGKSLMFDNGGNCPKGEHGKDMQSDMMGGAAVASEFARFGEEQPVMNADFVFGIAANKADGKARNLEDTYEHASGKTTQEINTDAEGRQVLGDTLWLAMRRLREEGQSISAITTLATLTDSSITMGGYRSIVMSSNKIHRRELEDIGITNGDRIQVEAIMREDHDATNHNSTSRADLQNVDPSETRGAQNAGAYIRDAAGIKDIRFTHWDIAPSTNSHPHGTPADVKNAPGSIICEGFLESLHQSILLTAQAAAPSKT